ncbi:MAG: DUF3365 domain-containing protein, partial [Bdellovibrionales bacterium]|nr:DUF3365 domain-containing protein [Bdellovibrionales bacterium]
MLQVKLKWHEILLVAGFGLTACVGPTKPSETRDLSETELKAYLVRGQQEGAELKKKLVGELSRGLKEGGAVRAISVCKDKADEVTSAAAKKGVKMGRTSLKLRNPNNKPSPWAENLLNEWKVTRLNTPAEARVVVLEEGRVGYAEPLYTMPLCLNCHGQNIKPEVAKHLTSLYPK